MEKITNVFLITGKEVVMKIKYKSARFIVNLIKIAVLIIVLTISLNDNCYAAYARSSNNSNSVEKNNISSEKKENILNDLLVALTGKVDGYRITIDNKILGYIEVKEDFNNIKEIIKEKYIHEKNIKDSMVKEFNLDDNIILSEERVDLNHLSSNEEIASNIYNIYKKNPESIKINIRYLKEEIESIKPSTVVVETENLFLGESKIAQGSYGVKKNTNEVIIESENIKSIKTINEEVIAEEVDKTIYKGTKNPYEYGIAFLKHPTGGGYMTSGYGERWNSFHKGIDIAKDIGEEVFSAMEGEVIYADYNKGGYGNLIIIEHEENISTYYAHLSKFSVKVGDKVREGDLIGYVGNTGFSTGPHLHFELRVNDNPVDPTNYILQ